MTSHSSTVPCTSTQHSATARVKVDPAQTGFFEGREFRSFLEFSLAAGASIVGRFTSPINFILFSQHLELDAGGVKLEVYVGATPGGTFSTALPIIGKNRMSDAPVYTPVVTLATGGTVTGGTLVDVVRLVAPGTGSNQSTVQGGQSDERGLPAGTYYLKLTSIVAGNTTGVYRLWWEERPAA
jgi:hypothetical protein